MAALYNNERVSVITPVYNADRYIAETVESAVAQTYRDIEIVLVDDCSKDNSADIIADLQKKYPNIVYHKQETNQGAAVARNTALNLATGRYVAFLDSDDLWVPEKIERQLSMMRKENCPFCYAAIDFMDEDGEITKRKRNISETCDYNYLLHNTIIATSTVVIDRNIMGDFQMPLRRGGQDYATWLMLLRGGTVARGINEVLSHYRISSNSLSSNKWKSIKQVWQIQTCDEKICKVKAVWNVCCFILNALRKYKM
jgi:teichuronic acid biosynthesis glycosyltransferase TuaG